MFVESLASAVEKAYWLVTVLYNLPAAVSTGSCFSPCPTLLSPPFPTSLLTKLTQNVDFSPF